MINFTNQIIKRAINLKPVIPIYVDNHLKNVDKI